LIRQIIHIDEELCNGCGACAKACHEGAIAMVNGKARLMREDFCDGLGDCLPNCPAGAIRFETREAPAYDEYAVLQEKQNHAGEGFKARRPFAGFPHSHAIQFECRSKTAVTCTNQKKAQSRLVQWPVQIKLVPVNAPFFKGAKLLIAADCTAYAYTSFHDDFMKGKITLIGCPKLDEGDYTEKLTDILSKNDILSLTVVRMDVPCCGGIQRAAQNALLISGKSIPSQVITISRDGEILD